MFKRNEGETSATDATSETSAFHGPLMLEGPKADSQSADTPIIDLEPLRATADDKASADAEPSETAAPEPEREPRRYRPSFVPLAATVAFAVAFGAIAGAAATSALLRDASPAPAVVAATDASRVLQDKVTQLGGELAALKSSLANSQRSASTQIGKLTERIDRTEKAQAEPAAKIAKLQDSIDRLEHRPQAAAACRCRRHRFGVAEGAVEAAGRRGLAAARFLRRPRHRREPQRHAVQGRARDRTCRDSARSRASSARTARSWCRPRAARSPRRSSRGARRITCSAGKPGRRITVS